PDVDRRRDAHAGPQAMVGVLPGLEIDLYRDALHHLHEVAGRVLRRQQAELGAGRRGDAVDVALELAAAERVHFDRGLLAGTHRLQLRLLEVGGDPDLLEIDDRPQRLSRLDDLPRLDRLAADDAGAGGLDGGVFEVQLRLLQRGLGLRDPRLRRGGSRLRDLQLLRRGLRGGQAGARLRGGAARLLRALLGDGDRSLRGDDLRLRRIGRRACRIRRGDRGVELLLRDLVLLHQPAEALDVARGLRRRRFLLALARLRRDDIGLRDLDFTLGPGHAGFGLLHAARRGVDAGGRLDARDRHV